MDRLVSPAQGTYARRSVWWGVVLVGSVFSLFVVCSTNIPLGIPGEWAWDRIVAESDWFWNLVGGGVAAGLFSLFILGGRRRFESLTSRSLRGIEVGAWLTALVMLSFVWLWIVQEVAPDRNRLGKAAFVLFFPGSSGYFTRARYEKPDPSELLAGYEDLMRQGDVLHTGTHPPGLFLVFQGLIGLCEMSPGLSSILDATQPVSFREACDVIATNLQRSGTLTFLAQERRVLWLATLLVMLSASLTVVPLYGLLSRHIAMPSAWLCAALWPAVPAVSIFVPKSDVVFPFIGTTLMWTWLVAWDRKSLVLSLLSGFIAWCGLICSLAFLPVFLALGLLTPGIIWRDTKTENSALSADQPLETGPRVGAKHIFCLLAAIIGFTVPTLLLWQFAHANLLNIWWLNYQNHAGFYQQFTRTYWKWLIANPVELSIAVGFPVAVSGCFAGAHLILQICRNGWSACRFDRNASLASVVFVWGLLWLTGKNSGEAARLWILFMPWMVWLAGLQIDSMLATTQSERARNLQCAALLALQFVCCLLTVAKVNGFHSDLG